MENRKKRKRNMSKDDRAEKLKQIRMQYGSASMDVATHLHSESKPDVRVLDTDDLVHEIIAYVKETEPNAQCYGSRLKEARILREFTQERAAEIVGITHTTISDLENTNTKDPYFWEVFSIIYDVSPYFLLRKTNNPAQYVLDTESEIIAPIIPMSFAKEDRIKMIPFIVNTLTTLDENGMQCMEIMAQAANASDHGLIKLSSKWQAEPILCEVWDADFDEFLEKQHAKAMYESQERPVDCHERYLLAHGRSCVQVRTYEALSKLTRRDENVLEFFAKIAVSNDAVRKCFVRTASLR